MSVFRTRTIALDDCEGQYAGWLDTCRHALFFHHPSYLRLLEQHLGCRASVIVCSDGEDAWAGVLPVLTKTGNPGTIVNSLAYFGSNGCFLVAHNEAIAVKTALLQELENYSESIAALSWNIVSNYYLPEDKDFVAGEIHLNNLSERIGQVTELPPYGDDFDTALMNLIEDPRPRNIRKALKSGVTVEKSKGSAEDWAFLYRIHRENMEAIGAPVKREDFFTAIPHHVSDKHYSLFTAMCNGEKIAALLVFHYNDTVEYYTPGTDVAHRNLQPSALLIFEAMKQLAAEGYRYWNWGGTASRESGVFEFKKKWGAMEKPYWHMTKIRQEKLLHCTPEEITANYYGFFAVPFNQLKNQ